MGERMTQKLLPEVVDNQFYFGHVEFAITFYRAFRWPGLEFYWI